MTEDGLLDETVFSDDISEVVTSYVKEDFTAGDRVWYKHARILHKGTVIEATDRCIVIASDERPSQELFLYYTNSRGHANELWGRIPDLKQLEAGIKLSYLRTDGKREQGVIVSVTPDTDIVFERRGPSFGKLYYSTKKGMDLELKMMNWEIEG